MPKPYAARAGRKAVRYGIVIRGSIGRPLVGQLASMRVVEGPEETTLVGDIVDQAQLHGVLSSLSKLGVEIVSVNPLERQNVDA